MELKPTEEDLEFIRECIALSKKALENGDKPFGAIIVLNGKVISKAINKSASRVYDHAELVVLDLASKVLGTMNLSGCTLYSNCEPCHGCSFFIREYHISKLVYAISSPGMGGVSRYPIIKDKNLTKFKPYFGEVPDVISNVLEDEALEIFKGTPLEGYFGSMGWRF